MERHKRIVAASLAVALLLAACSDGDGAAEGVQPIEEPQADPGEPEPDPVDEDPEPEVEPEPEPEPESEPADIDITAVPDEITEEYVEAVFVELERLYSEAVAELRRNDGELNIEVSDRLGEIFENDSALTSNLEVFQEASEGGFPNIREPEDIGPRTRSIVHLLSVDAECVYVETTLHPDALVIEKPEVAQINFVELLPKTVERPVVLNKTPWVYGRILVPQDEQDVLDFTENNPCFE